MELPSSLAEIVAGYRANPSLVGESGAVIHQLDAVGRPVLFLKQGGSRVATDIVDEYARLRWLQGRWQVSAIVGYAETEAGAWLLTTALPGRAAYGWLEDHPDRRETAMRSIAAFLRLMHAEPIATCPFDASLDLRSADAAANVVAGRVDLDDLDPEREGWSAEQLWDHFQRLLLLDADPVVTHGDFSLDNIFLDDDGTVTGCLDVGRVGVADRYQDLAILWNSLREFDLGLAEAMFEAYGVAPDREKIELHLLFDEFF
ncbi:MULTISPECIES: APH(3') family aminoglycoside O-phosphotransferase [Sphingomonas]|uniref:APH(3') family aminoglycoside O-phosphotransferase n=1 Tax=Sphingomonas TaxID=13687 RepID=UPI00082EFA86|nr:APH(3') family aminoglycoside O-phosphotransferase [Sphingomonas sp. CCH10-B3]